MNFTLRPFLGIFFLVFFAPILGFSQFGNNPIKYLGVENGLSNNVVNALYQDRFGLMWMGTNDGLNRYDGYAFKVFRNKRDDQHSLINNHIKVLSGDGNNRVWIGTQKGVSYYDYTDSKLHSLSFNTGQKSQLLNASINAIAVDPNGNVYVATDNMGFLVKAQGALEAVRVPLGKSSDFTVKAIAIVDHQVWLFSQEVGLCKYDPRTKKIVLLNSKIADATAIVKGANKTLWIGTQHGLFNYDIAKNDFRRSSAKLSNENILGLCLDHKNKLWVATDGGGVSTIDLASKQVVYLRAGTGRVLLTSNSIGAILEDKESRKWLATLRGGVNVIDPANTQFNLVNRDPFQNNTLVDNFVLSFAQDKEQNIWIGTDGGGLSIWNRRENTYRNFVHNPNIQGSLSSNFVTSILNDFQGQTWVATFSGGIDRYDRKNNSFKHYSCYNTLKGLEDINLWKLYEDKKRRLWASSTKGGAMYLYNRNLDVFELFDAKLKDVQAIFEDSNGILWAGDYTRLIRVDVKGKQHQFFTIDFAIRSIYEDQAKNFWIGTEGGGLLLFNRADGKITRFTEADGLPSNSVLNILEDKKGNLWCSTYNGLSKFNVQSRAFKNYFSTDGLQSNQFNYNAALRLSDGEFLFGGIKGFNRFYPDSIRTNKRIPKIVITDFKVNNIPIEKDPDYQREISVVDPQKVTVPYSSAVISVEFAAIEFSFQDQIKYAYYLEGWDRNWNFVDKLNTAYYSRLDEGTYRLHIKSTDTDGSWANNEKIIEITILPPWYRAWWAYLAYFIVSSALYYLFWKYTNRQKRLKQEVQFANREIEREKELHEKKLNFFTNISHELRTPLTLIVNPIKDILATKEDGQEKNDLNVVYRNSRRLLSLVDQLLLFRKTESENDALKIVSINLTKLANEIFLCFGYLAKINVIGYKFNAPQQEIFIYADRDKIEIILFNLLSNALKFTPKYGFVTLNINEGDDVVLITVKDSGAGIPAEVGDKLFDKFFRVMNNTSLKIGFGIGLYLVRNFVESHQGKISYTSDPENGTCFLVELPTGQDRKEQGSQPLDEAEQLSYVNELLAHDDESENPKKAVNLELLISDLHSILIVEDNEQITEYISQIFELNFKIYKAVNGLEGLQMSRAYLPDIIISDINMEHVDGIELCKQIKDDPALSHIPVILLTADPTPELRLKGIEVGAYDFISKPFDKDLFMAKINGVIKTRSNLQNYFYNEITLKTERNQISEEDKSFIQKTILIIEENLIEPDFSVKTLAAALGMSHSNLYKKIKASSGLSINSFVRFIRLRKAAELLINTNLNINEAAFRVGINDIKYFRAQFQNQFKLTPSEFVKKHRKTFHKSYSLNTNQAVGKDRGN